MNRHPPSGSIRCTRFADTALAYTRLACCVACISGISPAHADSIAELKQLSLEQLMNIEVTSVSKVEESLGGAAAAVTIVSSEDIRRSGATSIPEALRNVPGLHVARNTASTWAVSARGFSSVRSEKLLVLTDTRSIYTPLFSGVFWDVQDYVLQDIKSIEVVRGPGATLWGSNAVNGVINITTKKASETQGLYLSGLAGSEDRTIAARYGGSVGNDWSYRVFAKYLERDATFIRSSQSEDDCDLEHIGFRVDRDAGDGSQITVQGELYSGETGQLAPSVNIVGRAGPTGDLNVDVSGGNLLTRWQRQLDSGANLQLRAYYDRTRRDDPTFIDELDTIDFDLQYRFTLPYAQDIVTGLNYRLQRNHNQSKVIFALDPEKSSDDVVSGFIQDQLTLTDALRLTLGTKLEHNDFSGFEVQPTARLAWNLAPNQTAWAAVSRAVRIPTRLERDIAIDVPSPSPDFDIRLLGSDRFESERLLAYELGYRWQLTSQLTLDTAAFHNRYRDLSSLEQGDPFVDQNGRTVIPITNRNLTDGEATGFEALAVFSPLRNWRITVNYSYVDVDLDPQGADINRGRFFEGATPRHIYGIRSYLDLPAGFQIDVAFRSLSAVRRSPDIIDGSGIPGYSELDVKLAWSRNSSEIALVGQNLLNRRHVEFGSSTMRGEIERSGYLRVTFGF